MFSIYYTLHSVHVPFFIFRMEKVVKEEVEVKKGGRGGKEERLEEVGILGKFPNQSHQVMTFYMASFGHHSSII